MAPGHFEQVPEGLLRHTGESELYLGGQEKQGLWPLCDTKAM